EPVCSCASITVRLAHEIAGAVGTRLSLRPQRGGRRLQNSGTVCRENNRCRPGAGRDPYAAADVVCNWWSTALLEQLGLWLWAPAFAGATAEVYRRPRAIFKTACSQISSLSNHTATATPPPW